MVFTLTGIQILTGRFTYLFQKILAEFCCKLGNTHGNQQTIHVMLRGLWFSRGDLGFSLNPPPPHPIPDPCCRISSLVPVAVIGRCGRVTLCQHGSDVVEVRGIRRKLLTFLFPFWLQGVQPPPNILKGISGVCQFGCNITSVAYLLPQVTKKPPPPASKISVYLELYVPFPRKSFSYTSHFPSRKDNIKAYK